VALPVGLVFHCWRRGPQAAPGLQSGILRERNLFLPLNKYRYGNGLFLLWSISIHMYKLYVASSIPLDFLGEVFSLASSTSDASLEQVKVTFYTGQH
jgi:hypothetical protein